MCMMWRYATSVEGVWYEGMLPQWNVYDMKVCYLNGMCMVWRYATSVEYVYEGMLPQWNVYGVKVCYLSGMCMIWRYATSVEHVYEGMLPQLNVYGVKVCYLSGMCIWRYATSVSYTCCSKILKYMLLYDINFIWDNSTFYATACSSRQQVSQQFTRIVFKNWFYFMFYTCPIDVLPDDDS